MAARTSKSATKRKGRTGRKPSKVSTKARKKKTPGNRRRGPGTPAGGSRSGEGIRVRMYRVGFGDCFLLTLPTEGGTANVLIDCGVHSRGDLKTMPSIVADIEKETGGRLELVIASHAHQDHVSGFGKAKDTFRKFSVSEVWLPWTEDPDDQLAIKLRRKRNALALALQQHFAATGVSSGPASDAVLNAVGNVDAMALLKSGINGGKVRYLKGGISLSDVAGIKGLSAHILGPPTDEKFLSVMDPPSGDRFMRLDGAAAVAANAIEPFDKMWIADQTTAPLSLAELKDLTELLDESEGLAFTLDSVLNNTSLVVLFSYRGKTLLFPGDAQYGNWRSWMESADGTSILSHLNYFKIAHHGSHNATPKSALDKTPEKAFAAHISTQNKPWGSIPFKKMLDELDVKASGYVRSDSIPLAGVKGAPKGPAYKETQGFTLGPFWSDYTLAL